MPFKDDPLLELKRTEIIQEAARKLDKAKMIRFDERTNYLFPTDLGRTSSQFYVKYDTIGKTYFSSKYHQAEISNSGRFAFYL